MQSKTQILMGVLIFYAILGVLMGAFGSWYCGLGDLTATNYNDANHLNCVGVTSSSTVETLNDLAEIPFIGGVFAFLGTLAIGGITTMALAPWWINTIIFTPLATVGIFLLIPGEGS